MADDRKRLWRGIGVPVRRYIVVLVGSCVLGSATQVMLTTRFRATVGQKSSRKQGVTSSYGR